MELSKDQVQSILNDAKPSIIAGLREEVIRHAKWEFNSIVSNMIEVEVKTFMESEIIPIVRQNLIEEKEGLISVSILAAKEIAIGLAQAMSQTLKERLENSYNRSKILEALFK